MKKLGILFFALLNGGCFFGTFQTAETIGAGEVNGGWYMTYPLYFNRNVKKESTQKGIGSFDSRPNLGGFIEYGAAQNIDFGLWGSLGEGLGPFFKLQIAGKGNNFVQFPADMALLAGFSYQPVADGIIGKIGIISGTKLSPYSYLYMGWLGVNTPDYRKLELIHSGSIFDKIRNEKVSEHFEFFNALVLGIEVNRKRDVSGNFKNLPFGITMEFTLPLIPYPALFFGIQFKR